MKPSLFLIAYGLVVAVGFACVAFRPDFFGNVGFLVLGLLAGIYPSFILEEFKRSREKNNLRKALFQELAKFVGRCCFDFEKPWQQLRLKQQALSLDYLRKFSPDVPVIYPAVAPQIALLENEEAQAIIEFYATLEAWRRAIDDETINGPTHRQEVPHGPVRILAERLRRTLEPGKRALESLAKYVPGADEIEINALKTGDRLFPKDHPHAGETIRARIKIILDETNDRPGTTEKAGASIA